MDISQYKKKNWQWRAIVWCSLFLIFGKVLSHWTFQLLGIDQAYSVTSNALNRVAYYNGQGASYNHPPLSELIIDVRNDTPSVYSVASKISSGQLNFERHTFAMGETKRFTVKPTENSATGSGFGDILFTSMPILGNDNSICREIHVLNYDLQYATRIKMPLTVNLSAISSKMQCSRGN